MGEGKRGDDGFGGSAPSSSVGSLLTDLLSEAKKDVAAERQQLERQIHQKANLEREARVREEARQRESMQQQLVEETRLRNQALAGAKKDRPEAEQRAAVGTAPHTRPRLDEAAVAHAPAPAALAGAAAKRRSRPWAIAVAMVLIGAGLGVGGASALSTPARINLPDIQSAAQAIVAQTAKAALAEGRVTKALDDAQSRLKALEGKMEEALTAQKALTAKFEETQKELDATKAQLAEAADGAPKRGNGGRNGGGHGSGNTSGIPNINTGVFK